MGAAATFIHITDTHLSDDDSEFKRDDHKVRIAGIQPDTRHAALDLTLKRLAEHLVSHKMVLQGVLFTGDAQDKGKPGGHQLLLELLLKHFGAHGITAKNIVAIPGNHDVVRDSAPSSEERYREFIETWRKAGCVTPWIDGVDSTTVPYEGHRLVDDNGLWAVYPINSSNWSQTTVLLEEPLASVWNSLPKLASPGDSSVEAKLRAQLNNLARYDMARVSPDQLEYLRRLIQSTNQPASGRQTRLVLTHHHLRAPSLREEVKPFADFSNLELIRAFLRDRDIAMVLHGHKHESSVHFEHIYDQAGATDHRTLVVSGSTLDEHREVDAVRLVVIEGMPYRPMVQIKSFPVSRGGVDITSPLPIIRKLWVEADLAGTPLVIQGSDLDEVYSRGQAAAESEAKNGMLIIHLDLPNQEENLPLPRDYPLPYSMEPDERATWLKGLVSWWQLDRSRFEHRIPFVHGGRLRRYGGAIDQIERVKAILGRGPSTRALATLIDPIRDFTHDGQNEEFASFCLVEFKRRNIEGDKPVVDAIAFYRAQEIIRWWPINIAELRSLQCEICSSLGFTPGRITTFTADARARSRTPTQVAIPIIDRWLDQSPERLLVLANSLVHGGIVNDFQRETLRQWDHTLSDLEAVAAAFNPDGVPLPIEGMKLLAAYLDVSQIDDNIPLKNFSRTLRSISNRNQVFETNVQKSAEFQQWSEDTKNDISDLRALTQKIIQPE